MMKKKKKYAIEAGKTGAGFAKAKKEAKTPMMR